jgi:hypothetical protein
MRTPRRPDRSSFRPSRRALLTAVLAAPVLAAFVLAAFVPDDTGTAPETAAPGATPDPAVTALLPSGPNTFTFRQTVGSERTELSGYIDFSDCTTDASGSVTTEKGTTRFEFRNDGTGEAVRANAGAWYDIADPAGPLLAVYSPTHIAMFTVEQERGMVCAIGLLDDLATLDSSPTAAAGALTWDAARSDRFHAEQAAITGEKIFRAYGASDAEIAATGDLIQQLFVPDVTSFRAKSSVTISVDGADTVIAITANGATADVVLRSEFRFTPTARRDVTAVPFERYLEKLAAEAKASGKSFEELLTE